MDDAELIAKKRILENAKSACNNYISILNNTFSPSLNTVKSSIESCMECFNYIIINGSPLKMSELEIILESVNNTLTFLEYCKSFASSTLDQLNNSLYSLEHSNTL